MATTKKTIVSKIATKKIQKQIPESFTYYKKYKKAKAILSEAEIAYGRGFYANSSEVSSTLDFEINRYAILSTTTQDF